MASRLPETLQGDGQARMLDAELEEELQSHIDLAVEENLRHGSSEEEARRAAVRAFGGLTQTREAYRMQRGFLLIELFGQDVRYALRQWRARTNANRQGVILVPATRCSTRSAFFKVWTILVFTVA